jgi:hypothetical protein
MSNLQLRHGVIHNNKKKEQQTFNTSASGATNVKKKTPEAAIPPTKVLSPEDAHVGRNMSCDFKRL